jgi:hypothetical protein
MHMIREIDTQIAEEVAVMTSTKKPASVLKKGQFHVLRMIFCFQVVIWDQAYQTLRIQSYQRN